MAQFTIPTHILSTDGKRRGVTTGATYRCTMAGCCGVRIAVRWPDGKITRPCSKGLVYDADGSARIG